MNDNQNIVQSRIRARHVKKIYENFEKKDEM